MKSLSTKDLVITRKRKKWKFAHFDSWENCFSFPRDSEPSSARADLNSYFARGQTLSRDKLRAALVVELAAGAAEFSLELARRHPEKNFVAVDIKSDRLYTSAKKALEEGVGNIAFVRMHINEIEKVFGKNNVDEIWLTFPDPHPKKRSAKHRLTHVSFLQQYRNILKDTGQLKFKTDNRELFLWSLEQFVAQKWQIHELNFDLHESDLSEEYKIKTTYEHKFTLQEIPINLVTLNTE